jgi:hypothetical protein
VLNCLPKSAQAKGKQALHNIWQAETQTDAEKALIKQILDHLRQKAQTSESVVLPENRAPPVGLTHGLLG